MHNGPESLFYVQNENLGTFSQEKRKLSRRKRDMLIELDLGNS